ncbi:MAG TPA: type I methionyl aminopeptidase, partial [Cutibacterium acnes]|nr:type I methionyl aminopeptidase [Cutibacterium acnes]
MSAIKPYPQSPRRHVPGNIARPPYVGLGDVPETYDGSHV